MRQKFQNVKYLQTRTSAEKLELLRHFSKRKGINVTNIVNAAIDTFINKELSLIDITEFVKENPKLGEALVVYKKQEKTLVDDICGELAFASGNPDIIDARVNMSRGELWTPETFGSYDLALMDTARKVVDEYCSMGYSPTLMSLQNKKGTAELRVKRRYDTDKILEELKNL